MHFRNLSQTSHISVHTEINWLKWEMIAYFSLSSFCFWPVEATAFEKCKVEVLSLWQLNTGRGVELLRGYSQFRTSVSPELVLWYSAGTMKTQFNLLSHDSLWAVCIPPKLTYSQAGRKWTLALESKCPCFSPVCMTAPVVQHCCLNSGLAPR